MCIEEVIHPGGKPGAYSGARSVRWRCPARRHTLLSASTYRSRHRHCFDTVALNSAQPRFTAGVNDHQCQHPSTAITCPVGRQSPSLAGDQRTLRPQFLQSGAPQISTASFCAFRQQHGRALAAVSSFACSCACLISRFRRRENLI